jgi:hypothetical protein
MRKTSAITLTVLAAVAASVTLSDCRDAHYDEVSKHCVDNENHIVPDSQCRSGIGHFVYGGSSGGRLGDTVVDGSLSEHAISRGGYGLFGGEGAGGE